MIIDLRGKDPYKTVIDVVRKMTMEDGYEHMADWIVRLKIDMIGETNELLLLNNGDYYFQSDWYEGAEQVELIGVVNVEDVRIPQETEVEIEGGGYNWWDVCKECHGNINKNDLYCKHCGRKVIHK